MDIRTKLIFALVAVSLASMFVFGVFTYGFVSNLMEGMALRQLEAVADAKKEDLERVTRAWQDRVRLVASRTQLKESLTDYRRGTDPDAPHRIERSLDDALESVHALRGIVVYAPDGRVVAARGFDPNLGQNVHPLTFWLAEAPVVYEKVFLDPDGELVVGFVAPIRLGVELIGAAKVILSAHELVEVTDDFTGLGKTGETLLARRTAEGGGLILNPLRHDAGASLSREVAASRDDDPTIQAVLGNERVLRQGARDYRDEEVWAATRYLDDLGWGLVVKVDRAEEMSPVDELRDTMVRLAVALSAFAIVMGTVLGFTFARPIRALATVAHRIREGELDVRARAGSDDEIGGLAATFNRMAEELIAKNRELERRVRDHENGVNSAPRSSSGRAP